MRAVIVLLALLTVASAGAQITAEGRVVNGHHHFNAVDVAEHQRFWVEALGGRAGSFANGAPIAIFPNALIFTRDQDPTGGMIGSTLNHVAFSVPNLRAAVDRIKAAGFKMITTSEAPAGVRVVDDIGVTEGPVTGIAYVEGPDGIKVEVLEMRAQSQPIVSSHIHFFGENPAQMRAWYIEHFGAVERPGSVNGIISADLPGLGLSFSVGPAGLAPTTGRVLDHIGFEVENLEAFTQTLAAKGVPLALSFRRAEALGLSVAFVVDPWGTRIELNEGLRAVK